MFEWLRALHIISVIYWMAGLLYLPRLFVYHSSAELGGELDETLKAQERRLLKIIMNPAMIASLVFGLGLLHYHFGSGTVHAWLLLKFLLVFGLMGYHMVLAADRKKFEAGQRPRSEKFYRVANEVPAIAALIVVILAVVEPF